MISLICGSAEVDLMEVEKVKGGHQIQKHVGRGRRGRSETKLSSVNSNNLDVLLHSTVTVDNDDILHNFDEPEEIN